MTDETETETETTKAFSAEEFFSLVDEHKTTMIEELATAVAIPSVSAELDQHLDDIVEMMEWTDAYITKLGGSTTTVPNPASTLERPLPPILLGEFKANDPSKKTVCVYGHLDVQPAAIEDGWDTDPFVLTEKDGKLFGRGSTDDKGPALSWLWIISLHQTMGVELPVNIKILFEGMEESGSLGIFEVIQTEGKPGKFLDDVDFFCISDNYWLGKTKPCLTYGLRGLAYFELSVEGFTKDLHSGVLGGTVFEPMTDLISLMGTLVESSTGKILVPGVYDSVAPVTPEEEALYETIDFDAESFKEENGIKAVSDKLLCDGDKKALLMNRWRNPTLSLHGIEGAFSGKGAKTVIPKKVIGKFSLRLVPDQDPKEIEELVTKHLRNEFAKLGSPNKIKVELHHGAHPWLSDPNHPNFEAAARAIELVYGGTKPDYTREGGSIPITSALENATGMNVLLLPIGACDDGAHSQNEKYNVANLLNGVKVLGVYLHELGTIKGPKPSSCKCPPKFSLTDEELMVPGAFVRGFACKCVM
uniref:Peptidase M20 dimerisation domain-containing protein n=1 Tax=Pseudo-nitzschia australis TaxID=44445 RepID=A0A7S4A918_9STRA|mmetsp:Transcript_26943/g.59183  ORF Transcript_26943/g.59183 Transcript_26943/m.59183 type:complete len:531 (-) Transcript_26943:186-1778(-)